MKTKEKNCKALSDYFILCFSLTRKKERKSRNKEKKKIISINHIKLLILT